MRPIKFLNKLLLLGLAFQELRPDNSNKSAQHSLEYFLLHEDGQLVVEQVDECCDLGVEVDEGLVGCE